MAAFFLVEQMYASSNASRNHADTFGSGSFEVKREYVETANDDESNKVSDGIVMSRGGKANKSAKSRKHRSFVWKYFTSRGTNAVCSLCRKTLKQAKSNTTNLIKHLQRDHRKEHAVVMEETGRRMMEEATRNMVR